MNKVILLLMTFVIPLISFTQNGKVGDKAGEPIKQTIQIELESEALKCYVGTYLLHTDTFNMIAEITLKNNSFYYYEKRGVSTFEAELHPLTPSKFFLKKIMQLSILITL